MATTVKVGGFAVGLAAVFTAALAAGNLIGPAPAPAPAAHDSGGHTNTTDSHGAAAVSTPDGLAVARDGYRLVPVTGQLATAGTAPFAFRILGPDGRPVTRYTPTHEKDLHLIVVRRDLSGFQHVHPTMAPDGTWTIPLHVATAGQYRVFADFQPADRADGLTLGVDVPAIGAYRPVPLPAASRATTVDGYTITLAGDLRPGTASRLTLTVSKDGAPVTDLQPYLGAYGHLVALRDGDLAYLHVHPDGAPADGKTRPGPQITFYAEVPSAGAYRLYLDFRHGGTVRTAEFTAVAGPAPAVPVANPTSATPSGTGEPGHGEPGHGHN